MPAATPPPPGSASPGDLYVDLQSRSLWLGVDPAVDPAEVVLLSDYLYELELIEEAEEAANDHTDTQLLTRAPVSHTHTASQITDFSAAVTAVINAIPGFNWVPGMIMVWSGALDDIGVGDLAGWALCDGTNGTPDLRDRFIIGAGNRLPGSTNPQVSATTSEAGSHTHTINGTALTVAQIPSHNHGGSGTTGAAGNHTHSAWTDAQAAGGYGQVRVDTESTLTQGYGSHSHNVFIAANGNHAHTFSLTTGASGMGQAHTHTESTAPVHSHTLSQAALRDMMPFYALAYIMKL